MIYKIYCTGVDANQEKSLVHPYSSRMHLHLHRIVILSDRLCNRCESPERLAQFLIQCGKCADARHELHESIPYINITILLANTTERTRSNTLRANVHPNNMMKAKKKKKQTSRGIINPCSWKCYWNHSNDIIDGWLCYF